jgi:hypothetical protein
MLYRVFYIVTANGAKNKGYFDICYPESLSFTLRALEQRWRAAPREVPDKPVLPVSEPEFRFEILPKQ